MTTSTTDSAARDRSTVTSSTGATESPEEGAELVDAPPVFGSWTRIYLVVLGTLAAVVAVCAAITEAYR